MGAVWQLQDAKNKLSEVVDRAADSGPQQITRRGKKAAVVLSFGEYKRLLARKDSLTTFFQKSPLHGLDFTRQRDYPREVDL